MVERIPDQVIGDPFLKWEMTLKGDIVFKALYIRLQDFLAEEDWEDLQGGDDDYETFYQELHQADFVNHSIWWRAKRTPKFDGNGDLKFYLYFDMDTFVMTKTEKIIDGQKVKMDNGEMRFTCQLFIYQGYKEKNSDWETNPLLKFYKGRFWDREHKHFSSCKKELTEFSRDFYKLIQTFGGVQPEEEIRDHTPVLGTHN